MLKAVIFDLDGLLIDSTPVQQEANRIFLNNFGKIVLPSTGREGMRIIDIIREYKDIYDLPGSVEELYAKRQAIFFKLAKVHLKLYPGANQLVEKLNKRSLRLALATSGDRDYVNLFFGKFPRISKFFSTIVTSEDVRRGKPYPDVYQIALVKLNIAADEVVVLEDSVNGITAAKTAGLQVICVPNRNYPEADYSQADKIFPSLVDISLAIT